MHLPLTIPHPLLTPKKITQGKISVSTFAIIEVVSSNAVKSIPEDGSFGDGVREVKAFDALKTLCQGTSGL